MLWLYIALAAYFIDAIAFIIDKYLLSSPIPRPFAYAFWVSILSLTAFALLPFGVFWINQFYFIVAFISGAAFFAGLIFLYKSIKLTDVSIAATNAGVISAVFTYLFSLAILKDKLPFSNEIAFLFLVVGIFFLGKAERGAFKHSLFAGLFFGLSFVLLKWTFNEANFINGIFWTRMGFIGAGVLSLIFRSARKEISHSFKTASYSSRFLFVLSKITAGAGFFLLYYAIKLGDVALVSALLGTQFLFLFILAILLRNKVPGIAENISGKILLDKLLGIGFIIGGFIALFKF